MGRISGRHPSCWLTTSGLVGFALALVGLFALSVRVLSSVEVLQDNTAEGSGQRVVAPPAPKEIVDPQLKHLVIDKVYFPKNREDAGVASVQLDRRQSPPLADCKIQRQRSYVSML